MVLKYTAYLCRSNKQVAGFVLLLNLLMSLSMQWWTRSVLLSALLSIITAVSGYFMAFWPAYIYYRSLYGAEAQLVHQIPAEGRDLLKGHLLFSAGLYLIFQLLAPGGVLNMFFRPELWAKAAIGTSLFSLKLPSEAGVVYNPFAESAAFGLALRNYILSHKTILVLFLAFVLLGPVSTYTGIFAAVSRGCRLQARKNRLLSVLLSYLLLLVILIFSIFVCISGISVLFILRRGQQGQAFGDEPFQGPVFEQPFFADYLGLLLAVLLGFCLLVSIATYFYSRRQLEKKLNIC